MPKGYAIFTETIRDQAGYDRYVQKAVPTILPCGRPGSGTGPPSTRPSSANGTRPQRRMPRS